MIPKIIHYIWLGGKEEPSMLKKCKKSWKKYCPDYEIKRWDETNLNMDFCKYCREAYDAKKYAFASDVLRFDILSKYGGVYLDIDVELLKPIDDLLEYELFTGFENSNYIAPGLILGVIPNHKIICELMEDYKTKSFKVTTGMKNQETICEIFTNKMKTLGFKINNLTQEKDWIKIFSSDYFAPKSMTDGKIRKTEHTYSIHHYASTWVPFYIRAKIKFLQLIKRLMGEKLVNKIKAKKCKKQSKKIDKKQ